jgi:hypothetical protein
VYAIMEKCDINHFNANNTGIPETVTYRKLIDDVEATADADGSPMKVIVFNGRPVPCRRKEKSTTGGFASASHSSHCHIRRPPLCLLSY